MASGFRRSLNWSKNTKNECNICSEPFASKRALNYHNRARHSLSDVNLICDICGSSLPSDTVLMVHKQIHEWEKEEIKEKYFNPMHECSACDWKTRSPGNLVLHCFKTHPSLDLFTTNSRRKIKSKLRYDENQNKIPAKHAEACDLGPQVKCPLCDVFYGENRIKGHLMTVHPFHKHLFCSHCAAIIPDGKKMKVHLLEHSRGKDLYKCEFCEYLFISAQALATHGRLHEHQSPFSCSVCRKQFLSKTGAIAHFYSHLKIEMLRETMQLKADTSFAMPEVEENVARNDEVMITPPKEQKQCRITMEDSEDFVNVWN